MSRHRPSCSFRVRSSFLAGALVLTAVAAQPAGAAVTYRPPVDAPVVDPFRLPHGPYGAGNRGLEYATSPGTPVRAIGDGLVVFAGPVAGDLHVTVLHPDGLRSSYSFLAEILVAAGERVARGRSVGTAAGRFHLGVRSRGTYLDPAGLFTVPGVRLVPLEGPAEPRGAGAATLTAVRAGRGSSTWAWLTEAGGAATAGTLARRS